MITYKIILGWALFLFILQVVKKYYGGRDISEEDLEKALLVGMSPHEKRRLQKKRGISLSVDSAFNKNEVYEPENGSKPDIVDPSEQNGSDGTVFATCSSKLSLLGHGPHGKQVVDYLLKNHGENGIQEFCQRWRQVFVESINPRYLPGGWDVTHRYVILNL